jgi:6-phosphogluconolactonase
MATLTVADDEAALARAAADRIATLIEQTIAGRGSAVVCLTGGGTPRHLYSLLADGGQPWRARIDWSRVHLFWGDERHVPPDHEDSNFGMAERALLRHVAIPAEQIHRMRGELPDAPAAAAEYARVLAAGFARAGRTDTTFDVMLLGLGEDAHIASIFPGSDLLERPPAQGQGRATDDPGVETTRDETRFPADTGSDVTPRRPEHRQAADRVAAVWAPHLNAWRITLTPDAILDSAAIIMVVAGTSKADAVRAALEEPLHVSSRPAQLLRAAGDRVEWFVDRDAARRVRD